MPLIPVQTQQVSEVNDAFALLRDLIAAGKKKGDTSVIVSDLLKVLAEIGAFSDDIKQHLSAVEDTALLNVRPLIEAIIS